VRTCHGQGLSKKQTTPAGGPASKGLVLALFAQFLLSPPDPPGIPLLQAAQQTAYLLAQGIECLRGLQLQPELQRPPKCHFDPRVPAQEHILPRECHDDSDDVDRYRKQSAEQQRDERQRGEQY
jgi:hypothetical protein